MRADAQAWIVRMHGPDAADSAAAFGAWLEQDPRHRQSYDELQAHWDRAKFLTHTATGRSRNLESAAVWYRRSAPRYAAIAAMAVCFLAVSLVIFRPFARQIDSPVIAIATKTGEMRTVSLADGSTVTLDAASRIRVSITANERSVSLVDGMARFDVKHDPARSFVVLTTAGAVTANGSRFDVTSSAALVRVTALSGIVQFKEKAVAPGLEGPASLAIKSGQRLSVTAGRQPELASASSAGPQDWTSGMLSFDGERLGDAIAEINRHNDRKLALVEPALADLRITGAFRADDPAGFARTIAAMLGLTSRDRSDGTMELSRKK